MKEKFLSIILHPFFSALIITLVIIYFLPDYFTKYKVELYKLEEFGRESKIYFEDLDNDKISEKIICYNNAIGEGGFEIHNANGDLIDQWNLSSNFTVNKYQLYFLDVDKNGFKEIYTITHKKDSVFLNIVEPLSKNGVLNSKIFIETIESYNQKYNLYCTSVIENKTGTKNNHEVLFTLNSGFGGNPRNVYKFNFENNQVSKSEHLTNNSFISEIIDLDGDENYEILLSNNSYGNSIDSSYTKRSDYSSWLNVLNHKLHFLFDPVEFKNPFSTIETISFKEKVNTRFFVW